jgi:hypothetical protein
MVIFRFIDPETLFRLIQAKTVAEARRELASGLDAPSVNDNKVIVRRYPDGKEENIPFKLCD